MRRGRLFWIGRFGLLAMCFERFLSSEHYLLAGFCALLALAILWKGVLFPRAATEPAMVEA